MLNTSNDFQFFIPIDDLEKAKDSSGNEVYKIKGIASTSSTDDDGESIDPNGWDTSHFINYGFFNWEHQASKDPKALIGEPTSAKVTPKGLWVEGFLYDNELGRATVELAETLKRNGSKRKLGFSIEGKATSRDPFNKKKVLTAKLTNCAVTFCPKNSDSFADIVKGHSANQLTETQEDMDDLLKAIDTLSGDDLIKQSLKKKLVNLQKSEDNSDGNDSDKNKNNTLVTDSSYASEMKKSKEELQKIFDTLEDLGVKIDSKEVLLQKSQSGDQKNDDDGDDDDDDDLEKALADAETKLSDLKKRMELNKSKKKEKKNPAQTETGAKDDMMKSIADEFNGRIDSISQSFEEKIGKIDSKVEETFTEGLKAFGNELVKSIRNEIGLLKEDLETRLEAIEAIEDAPSQRKSIARPSERFLDNNLKKGNDGKKTLSMSRNKNEIINLIKSKSGIDGPADQIVQRYANALVHIETGNFLEKSIQDELSEKDNVLIIA